MQKSATHEHLCTIFTLAACSGVMLLATAALAGNPGESYIKACDDDTAAPEQQGKDCLYLGKIYLGGSPSTVKEPEGKAAQKKGCKLFDEACKDDVYNCLKYADALKEYEVASPPKSPEAIRKGTTGDFEKLCNDKNDAIACHLRALLYEEGLWGSKKDEHKAAELYGKACKNGNEKLLGYITHSNANRRPCDAEKKLQEKFKEELKKERFYKSPGEIEKVKKVKDLEKLCNSDGEPEACNKLAGMYATGKGAAKSASKAKTYRLKALEIWKFACDNYGHSWQGRSNGYECLQAGYAFRSAEVNDTAGYNGYTREAYTRLGTGCATGKIYEQCYWNAMQCKTGVGTLTSGPDHDTAQQRFKLACSNSKDPWIKKQACYQVELYKTSPSGTPYDPKTEKSKDGKWKIGDAERLAEKGDKCEKICGAKVTSCTQKISSAEPNIQNTRRMACYGPDSLVWGSDNPTWTMQTCIDKCRNCVKGGVRVWQGTECSVCAYGYFYNSDKLYCYAHSNKTHKWSCDEGTKWAYKDCIAEAQSSALWILFPQWRRAATIECQGYQRENTAECRAIPVDFAKAMSAAKTAAPESFKRLSRCCYRDETDTVGKNVLHVAAGAGNLGLVEYLVAGPDKDNRVEVFAKDKYGKTPLDYAEKGGHTAVVEYLRSKGGKRGGEYPPVFPFGSEQDVPTFTKISPPGGPAGASITVTGDHLDNDRATYRLGTSKVSITELSKTKLVFTIPRTAKTSYFSVTVGGWTGEYKDAVQIYKAPRLTSAKPTFAVVGDTVSLRGTNLEIIDKLTIGAKTIPIASKTSTTITFSVPPKTKTGVLTVSGPGGPASLRSEYEIFYPPTITKVTPVGAKPGEQLTIKGQYLDALKASFKLGRYSLKPTAVTEKQVTANVPSRCYSGTITVTAKGKTASSSSEFLVYNAPRLTSAKPTFAVVGDTVTLRGTNLEIIDKLTIGEQTIPIASKDSKTITFTVPPKTKTGVLTVSGPGGPASLRSEYEIFYPPTISKVTPVGAKPTEPLTIKGQYLDALKASFKLGRYPLKPTAVAEKQVTANVPSRCYSGTITVAAKGKTSASPSEFLVYNAPRLTSAKPTYAVVGDTVTLRGTNLEIIDKLTIGEQTIPIASKDSKTITFTVPPKTKTGALTVHGPGGTASLRSDYEIFYPPTITKVTPVGAKPGEPLTIKGQYLDALKASFKLGRYSLKPTAVAEKQVTATVPSRCYSGTITVAAKGKTAASPSEFLVYNAPRLTSAKPTYAVVGDTVTLRGTNLEIIDKLTIGAKTIPIASKDSKTITFAVPAGTTTGALTVDGPGGPASLKKEYEIFYPPTIDKVTVGTGDKAGTLIVKGQHFDASGTYFKLGTAKLKVLESTDKKAVLQLTSRSRNGLLTVTARGKAHTYPTEVIVESAE